MRAFLGQGRDLTRNIVWCVLDESMSMAIKFEREVDGVVHDAKISYEALRDHFGADDASRARANKLLKDQ